MSNHGLKNHPRGKVAPFFANLEESRAKNPLAREWVDIPGRTINLDR